MTRHRKPASLVGTVRAVALLLATFVIGCLALIASPGTPASTVLAPQKLTVMAGNSESVASTPAFAATAKLHRSVVATTAIMPAVDNAQTNPPQPALPPVQTYTVQPGDTLSALAGNLADELHKINIGIIGSNPDLIRPGQILEIPGIKILPRPAPAATTSGSPAPSVATYASSNSSITSDSSSVSSSEALVQKVINFARAQLGKPYEWGADGPGSFDCSGLTQAAYEAAGIAIPRNSAAQASAKNGTKVSFGKLLPGDLAFYQYPEGNHIVLVIGNGKAISAPETGDVVKIVTLKPGSFKTGIRFIQPVVNVEAEVENVVHEEPAPEPEPQPEPDPQPAPAPPAPPASDNSVWDRLAKCEASGNWAINTGNGYFGGLQFDRTTWKEYNDFGYPDRADKATKAQQIHVATVLRDTRGGYGAWPACSAKLGLPR